MTGDEPVVHAGSRLLLHVAANDSAQPGFVNLPHGYGASYSDDSGSLVQNGPLVNRLTHSGHCDPIAKTPYHKHLRVKIRAA